MQDQANDVKKYVMINKTNEARIKCTEKYLVSWLARGFEVEEIIIPQVKGSLQS